MSEAFSIGQPAPEPIEQMHGFEFTGSAVEFFRIWIVNISLTVLTLGIYSAWAKVRTSRYFAANTHLAGASFDYLANPIAILKGRAIVVGLLLAYSMASALSPLIQAPLGIALALGLPWAISRSLAFRAHNTAWRNIRFAFGGTYGEAFICYLVLPFVGLIPLGLGYPYAVFAQRRFMVDNAAFGTTRLRYGSTPGRFYAMFATLGVLAVGGFFAVLVLIRTVEPLLTDLVGESVSGAVLALLMIPLYFSLFAFYSAQIANLTYDGAWLDEHRVVSRVPAPGLAWIYLSNGIAILASLGLLIPWSHVRIARYRLSHMGLFARGSLDDFAAAQGGDVSSLGEQFGEAFDFDLGL